MEDWPYDIPGSSAVTAQDYLTESVYSGLDARVVNLCRCDHYQGRGYYVSLLGEARGHKPMPTVKTIEDLQSAPLVEVLAGEIDELLQDRFQSNADERYELTACFGRDFDEQHAALSQHLFGLVKAPLVRAEFERKDDRWVLSKLRALSAGDLSDPHRQRVAQAATDYVAGFRRAPPVAPGGQRPAVAILHDAAEADAPSNAQALDRFVHAANTLGMTAEIIDRRALERLDDFDGLFIRDTTNVGHYTYEFSRRAAARGLVVMDDPDSILKCTNKVYLNELMARHQIPMPKTVMV
ncbi:MAG TPA: RimK-like ATPgrasp N-terminal domain-containing protein, partial [Opitutaceae bacterium]|nr:RimK-like ATPgrasp N-terminal domain-containing protein [Opitutaceae bacterium]